MDYAKVVSNSTRVRIWSYVLISGEATTKDIAEHIPDVPVPTLYRHINFLIEQEAIIVKEERKVRGSRERILTGNMDFFKKATMYEYFSPYLKNLNERF
ncbi:MAG: helix-turn-helix transcriptional regulator, partial [Lachnospiraceae bacterium]|nr:helix-turn-helix transcriptional regulator [Lachnospiraceae bacterium]